MPTELTEEQRLLLEARELCLQALDVHEKTCRDPKCDTVISVAAYIAHSIGVRSSNVNQLEIFKGYLKGYEQRCPGCTPRN